MVKTMELITLIRMSFCRSIDTVYSFERYDTYSKEEALKLLSIGYMQVNKDDIENMIFDLQSIKRDME